MSLAGRNRIDAARRAAETAGHFEMMDRDRIAFLRQLDEAEVYVTDWEAQFIADLLANKRPLTQRQRDAIDGLRKSYEHQLPHTRATIPGLTLPPAPDGQCGYLVRDDAGGPQRRCGAVAVSKNNLGLELCVEHQAVCDQYRAKLREIKTNKLRR